MSDEIIVHEKPSNAVFNSSATEGLTQARHLVSEMTKSCVGKSFVAQIQGRNYATVQWWTAAGASLGIFAREVSSTRLEKEDDEICYEAVVEAWRGDQMIGRASSICSSKERTWSNRDEYAIKSMATTRATAKCYRLSLSFLAVLAGLEPTPSEEMPPDVEASAPPPKAAPKTKRKPSPNAPASLAERGKALKFFSGAGVTEKQLLAYLHIDSAADITQSHLKELRPIAADIAESNIDPRVFFNAELPGQRHPLVERLAEKHSASLDDAEKALLGFTKKVFECGLDQLTDEQADAVNSHIEAEDVRP